MTSALRYSKRLAFVLGAFPRHHVMIFVNLVEERFPLEAGFWYLLECDLISIQSVVRFGSDRCERKYLQE